MCGKIKIKFEVGQQINNLTVVDSTPTKIPGKVQKAVLCRCVCGSEKYYSLSQINPNGSRPTKSCGCLKSATIIKYQNIKVGDRYGQRVITKLLDTTIPNSGMSATRIEAACDCGKTSTTTVRNFFTYKSCGCVCKQDLVGRRFGRWIVLERIGQINTEYYITYYTCRCDCGSVVNVAHTSLVSGKSVSCGCYCAEQISKAKFKDFTGMRFGKLVAVSHKIEYRNKSRKTFWLCNCDCGNKTVVFQSGLARGTTKSCGCTATEARERYSINGKRFGKLTVISYHSGKLGNKKYLCRCDCGNTSLVRRTSLSGSRTSSCGKCGYFRNGRRTSKMQEKLLTIIPSRYEAVSNHKCLNYQIDIALPEHKIAIEYDSWYYHAEKQDKDRERANELIAAGWKVLSIKANGKLPSREHLVYKINQLENSVNNYEEIVLEDWGKGKTFKQTRKSRGE